VVCPQHQVRALLLITDVTVPAVVQPARRLVKTRTEVIDGQVRCHLTQWHYVVLCAEAPDGTEQIDGQVRTVFVISGATFVHGPLSTLLWETWKCILAVPCHGTLV
jgi:hypothetical protein